MIDWIAREVVKDWFDDPDVRKSAFVKRVTTKYEPQPWEMDGIEGRLAFYQGLGALSNPIREASREKTIRFILSFESALRQKGRVALPIQKDYWRERSFSDRIPLKFKRALVEAGYLSVRPIQISKRPMVFDTSLALAFLLAPRPDGEREGKFIRDRPQELVEVREPGFRHVPEHLPPFLAEMEELNAWLAANAERIEGLDDLRFHRIFQGNVHNGGRLYGAFTNMDKEYERAAIRIDREATDEADLNGAGLSILLLLNGLDVPEDPYREGELAQYDRELVKAVMTRIFGKGEWWPNRLPPDLHRKKASFGYPDGLPNYQDFKAAVIRVYPFLAELQPRLTFMLERYESEALMRTLHWLRERGEIGLPIHDGIRVKESIYQDTLEMFQANRDQVCREEEFGAW